MRKSISTLRVPKIKLLLKNVSWIYKSRERTANPTLRTKTTQIYYYVDELYTCELSKMFSGFRSLKREHRNNNILNSKNADA